MSPVLVTLSVFAIAIGLLFPSNRLVTRIQLIYMWLIFAFNTSNADYANYEGIYSRIGSGASYTIANYEEGFVLACSFCNRVLKMNYGQFVVMVASFTTILFAIVIKLYMRGKNQNIVISVFIIMLYWIMICQYRNYISVLIIMIGLYALFNREDKWGVLLYLATIIFAFFFHRSSILFLIFLLIKPLSIKRCIIAVPVIMLPLLMLRGGWLGGLISRYVASYKIQNFLYSGNTRTAIGVGLMILVRIILLLMEAWILESDKKHRADQNIIKFDTYTIQIMILSFSFLALEAFAANYERLFRIPMILSIIMLAKYKDHRNISIRKVSLQYIGLSGFYVLYMIAFFVSNNSWFYSVLIPVLTNNKLIGT